MFISLRPNNSRANQHPPKTKITAVALTAGVILALAGSAAPAANAAIVTRTPALNPFSIEAMTNTAIGSNAKYESSTSTMTKALLSGNPQVNRESWSIAIASAKSTDPLVTLTDTGKSPDKTYKIRIPVGTAPTAGTDKHVGIIQPDGVTLYEAYKFTKIDSTHYASTYVNVNNLKGDGLQSGSRASGISFLIGLVRTNDLAAKKIPHTIAISAPASMMKTGPVWPARLQDNQVGANIYKGSIPMGTQFAIPPSVDLTKLNLTPEGLALGKALQDYGAHVLVQAATVAVFVEPTADAAATERLRADYQTKLFPQLRRITNNTATTIGGGGTPRQPAAAPFTDDAAAAAAAEAARVAAIAKTAAEGFAAQAVTAQTAAATAATEASTKMNEAKTATNAAASHVAADASTSAATTAVTAATTAKTASDAAASVAAGNSAGQPGANQANVAQLAAKASATQAGTDATSAQTAATAATTAESVRRDPWIQPFSVTSPGNTAIGSNVQFESATATKTAALLKGAPQINSTGWSISVVKASYDDPISTVTNVSNGVVRQIRVPENAVTTTGLDKPLIVIQPDGYTSYECYKMNKVGTNQWTSTYIVQTDLRSSGITGSVRASGVSASMGLIRKEEVTALKIPHTLAISIPDSMLKVGPVWPATRQDGNAATAYKGVIPMGTMVAIPASVDINSLGLNAEGLALARSLQDYGAHVVDRSTTVALYAEPTADAAAVTRMRTDYQNKLYPLLRVITNNTATTVGGGGTPRQPAAAPLSTP